MSGVAVNTGSHLGVTGVEKEKAYKAELREMEYAPCLGGSAR
jgi:hypothetical protein